MREFKDTKVCFVLFLIFTGILECAVENIELTFTDVGKNLGGAGLEWWREDKDLGLISYYTWNAY